MTSACLRTLVFIPLVLLVSSPGLSVALAQRTTPQDERRLVEWAARLDAVDRPDEAISVLEGLLDERPASDRGWLSCWRWQRVGNASLPSFPVSRARAETKLPRRT